MRGPRPRPHPEPCRRRRSLPRAAPPPPALPPHDPGVRRRWAPGGIWSSGHAGLTVRDGRIFTGFSDGTAVALDASDGSVLWEQDTAAEFESAEGQSEGHQAIDIDTTPVVLGDTVYVASQAVGLLALDALGGSRRWTAPRLTGVTARGTEGEALVVSSVELGLIRVDPFDGRILWTRDLESRAVVNIQPLNRGRPLVTSGDSGLGVGPLYLSDAAVELYGAESVARHGSGHKTD